MGTGEGLSQTKTSKPSQEQQQSANSFNEWAAAFQAYYGSGAQPPHGAGYYSSATSGPQPHHPYIWGGQMMPYGAPPPPYPAMYPAGAMYHPSIPPGTHPYGQFSTAIPTTGTDAPTLRAKVPATSNGDAKTAEGNGAGPASGGVVKRCKSSLALVPSGSAGDPAKPGHNSGDGMSNSGDSGGSEDSSDSEDEPGQNGAQAYKKRTYEQNSAEASATVTGHGSTRSGSLVQAGNGGGPTTTLGVGMDYWQHSTASSTPIATTAAKGTMVTKRAVAAGAVVPIPPPPPPLPPPAPSAITPLVPATAREGLPPELWYQQDEREVKRQRRKQSNRESARRSRLRKQAECEELGTRVETLTNENMTLRTELSRLHEECKKLAADNAALKDELRYFRDDRSRSENGKGEQQQQQVTRANAAGEIWKKSLHLRKESTMSDGANGAAVASSVDRVTDLSNGRGGSVDGAGVAAASPGGLDRAGNERRSRSPSRNGTSHHHNANGSGSRRTSQGMGSVGKAYDEDGECYNDRDRSGKSPRGSSLGLDFGAGPETVTAG